MFSAWCSIASLVRGPYLFQMGYIGLFQIGKTGHITGKSTSECLSQNIQNNDISPSVKRNQRQFRYFVQCFNASNYLYIYYIKPFS